MADRPKRIQRSRAKGWTMPPGAVYVGRPTKWGNPWHVAKAREVGFDGTDDELSATCVALFRNGMIRCLPATERIRANIDDLRGKDLVCWCRLDQPCHADVLIEIANIADVPEAA